MAWSARKHSEDQQNSSGTQLLKGLPSPRPTTGTISFRRGFFSLFSSAEQYVSEILPKGDLAHHQATGTKALVITAKHGLRLDSFREQNVSSSEYSN